MKEKQAESCQKMFASKNLSMTQNKASHNGLIKKDLRQCVKNRCVCD